MEEYDFRLDGYGHYEIEGKSPIKLNLYNFKIKDGNDYIKFSYHFIIGKDIKTLKYSFTSSQHYKLGFYIAYEYDDYPFDY